MIWRLSHHQKMVWQPFSDSADKDGWAGKRVSYSRSFAEFCVSRDGWAGERMSY